MTVKELNQLYWIDKRITSLRQELVQISDLPAMSGNGHSGGISAPAESIALQKEKYKALLDDELLKFETARVEITAFIASVNDYRMQQILYLRHVKLCSWVRIGIEMGGTAESVRKMHKRFIENL